MVFLPETLVTGADFGMVAMNDTNEAVDELQLRVGDEPTTIVKASDVIVGK